MRPIARFLFPTALVAVLLSGCASDELTGTNPSNQSPEVWLSIAPPERATVDYNVHMFWGGFDPDGTISHFEWSITDNESGVFVPADTTGADKWHRTEAKDSVFVFTADQVADSNQVDFDDMMAYEFTRAHTFFIRSVDERGAPSKPVYRSFTARNLSPIITITTPKVGFGPARVPPIVTFKWSAQDFVGTLEDLRDPTAVRSILLSTAPFSNRPDLTLDYIRTHLDAPEWTDWVSYDAPGDSGRFWRPEQPLAFGLYVFALQARDEAGAVSPVFDVDKNVRTIVVRNFVTGPTLTVTNKFLGTVATSNLTTAPAILNLPAGVPVSFAFSADASSYGGVVAGYRFGWDIIDLSDPQEWEVDFTPFVGSLATSSRRTFFFGSHTFFVESMDDSGFRSRMPIIINIIPFTMQQTLLVVDDWDEGTAITSFFKSGGAVPSDEEHDAFWLDLLSDVAGFNPNVDVIPGAGKLTEVPITTLSKYRALIWNTRGTAFGSFNTVLEKTIRSDVSFNIISMFMAAGGKVMLCGDNAVATNINKSLFPGGGFFTPQGPSYPFIYRYEIAGDQDGNYEDQIVGTRGVGDESFGYLDCCLNVVDLAYGVVRTKLRSFCTVKNLRDDDRVTTGIRACAPVDPDHNFPRLELRPEVAGPLKFYNASKLSLNAELYNPSYFGPLCPIVAELSPQRACFQPIYTLECLDTNAATFGTPTAYWSSTYANVPDPAGVAARSVFWGFTPVYFNPSQVKQAMEIILYDEWKLPRLPQ